MNGTLILSHIHIMHTHSDIHTLKHTYYAHTLRHTHTQTCIHSNIRIMHTPLEYDSRVSV